MKHLRWLRRSVAVAVLAQSAALALLLPMADARAEIAATDAREHVEQSGSRECPPLHDEVACQMCRVLRLAGATSASSVPLEASAQDSGVPTERVAGDPVRRIIGGSSPRGPPSLFSL